MNRVYQRVWSESRQAWVVTSELVKSRRRGPVIGVTIAVTLLTQQVMAQSFCSDGTPSAGTCLLIPFDPASNDARVGAAVITTPTLLTNASDGRGYDVLAPGLSGQTFDTVSNAIAEGRIISGDVGRGGVAVSLGSRTQSVTYPDPITGSVGTAAVFDSANFAAQSIDNYAFFRAGPVGDEQYVDMRLGTVRSGGVLAVDVGSHAADWLTDSRNNFVANVKQSSVYGVEAGGVLNYNSLTRYATDPATAPASAFAHQLFFSETIFTPGFQYQDANGISRPVSNVDELRAYNDTLIQRIQAGTLPPSQYDAQLGLAYTQTPLVVQIGPPISPTDDVTQPTNRDLATFILGDGAGAVINVAAAASIQSENSAVGLVRVRNGATVNNQGQIGVTGPLGFSDAIRAESGGIVNNSGVVDVGTGRGLGVVASPFGGTRGIVGSGASQIRNLATGVINVSGVGEQSYDMDGIEAHEGSVVVNDGVINVATSPGAPGSPSFLFASGASIYSGTQLQHNGTIFIGRQAQAAASDATVFVASALPSYGILANNSNVVTGSTSQIIVGDQISNAAAIQVSGNASTVLTQGLIEVNGGRGASGVAPLANYGLRVVGGAGSAGAAIQNAGTIVLNGVNGIGILVTENSRASSSGVINVAGGADPATGVRNYGMWVDGAGSIGDMNGTLNLAGVGAIGVHARNAGVLTVGSAATINSVAGASQIAMFAYGDGSRIDVAAQDLRISTPQSTLFRVEDGADYVGPTGQALTMTVEGAGSRGIVASGARTNVSTGNTVIEVLADGATGIIVEGGSVGSIDPSTRIDLATPGAIAGMVDGQKHALSGLPEGVPDPSTLLSNDALVTSGTANVVGFITQNSGRLVNTNEIALGGADSVGVIARSSGVLENRSLATVNVTNGTAVRVEGGGAQIANDGLLRADDGIAALHLASGAGASLSGPGELYFGGTADGVLIDTGAANLSIGPARLVALDTVGGSAGSGAGIDNVGEIPNVQLTGTSIRVGAGRGIRTATNLAAGNTATINVSGAGIGFAFETAGGAVTGNDLQLGSGYGIAVDGAGGTGIRALTSGTVDTSAQVVVSSAAGGPALIAGTASSSTNRGALSSASQVAPVVDLTNGSGTTFTNVGSIAAGGVNALAVQGSGGSDTVNLAGGALSGVVATGASGDAINWTAGTLAGSLEMDADDDTLRIAGVNLATTYHLDGGVGEDALTFSGVTHRGGTFTADDLSKGVNLRRDWETINLSDGTEFTLTDSLWLGGSTVNIDASSTLFAGAGVNPVIAAADGVTVNNAGLIDLTNGASGPTDTLTIEGAYVGQGGRLRVESVLNEGGASSTSDVLRVQTSTIDAGRTLVDVVATGPGDVLTTGDGILVVDVTGSPSQADAFALGSRVVGGVFEYLLFQGGSPVNGGNAYDGNWYLRNYLEPPPPPPPDPPVPPPDPPLPPPDPPSPPDPPDPPPPDPPTPPLPPVPDVVPLYRPEVGAYLANQYAAAGMFVHTLHDRLGEVDFTERQRQEDPDRHGAAWLRVQRRQFSAHAGRLDQLKASTDIDSYHLGAELGRWDDGDRRWHYGVMGGYGEADTHTGSSLTGFSAKGRVTAWSAGLYATLYQSASEATGFYLDSWLMYGQQNQQVRGLLLPNERYDSRTWTGSLEAGHAWQLHAGESKTWYVEPQLQVVYTDYQDGNHVERNGTPIESRDAGGLTTRLGARIYSRPNDMAFNRVQPFVELNWWHAADENTVAFSRWEEALDIPQDRYELKLGAELELPMNWTAWGHVAFLNSEADSFTVDGLLGLKYGW